MATLPGEKPLRYRRREGPQRAVLMLHGAGSSSLSWLGQLKSLPSGLDLVAPDLPAHGQSPGPALTTLNDMVTLLRQTADALGLIKPIVIGHSMGGATALVYGSRFPDQVSGLVIVCSGARMPVSPQFFQAFDAGLFKLPRFMASSAYAKATDKDLIKWSLESFLQTSPEVLRTDMEACQAYRLDQPPPAGVPLEILVGEEDIIAPPKLGQELAALAPHGRLTLVPQAGHMVHHEQPGAVRAALERVLLSA